MQKSHIHSAVLFALALVCVAAGQTAKKRQDTSEPQHMIVPLSSMSLDGVVSGDPSKLGAPFVIRIQNDANFIVLPHWHPVDKNIVVVKGTWYVGMGDKFDRSALREMKVGDYALVPREMRHFAWSKTETIIQVHSIGPFKLILDDSWEMLAGWIHTPDDRVLPDPQVVSSFKFSLNDRVRSKRGEGLIVGALHSVKNKITEYNVQKDDGERFFESEDELSAVPPKKNLKLGPLTGTWKGVMHGLPPGDLEFKLYIQQTGEKITGVFSGELAGAAFSSSSFRNNALEIHMITPVGNFLLNAKNRGDVLFGQWSITGGLKGSWGPENYERSAMRRECVTNFQCAAVIVIFEIASLRPQLSR